jgi:hypothetical protein
LLKARDHVPKFMSSDAGYHLAKRPPRAAWSPTPELPRNITGAVIAAGEDYVPRQTRPLLAFIITGIELIRLTTPFLGELLGALLMSYLRSCFDHPIHAYMDCLSVIKILRDG